MEYLQCTHCSKKYGVNDKMRAAVGRAIRCKACNETFPIVIHGGEVLEEDLSVVREGGWDPSFTMPATDAQALASKEAGKPSESQADEDGELAAFIKGKKNKKKLQIQIASGLAVCSLLVLSFFFLLGGEPNLVTQVSNIKHAAENNAKEVVPAKLEDKDIPECRKAAAAQWMIDARIMHADYTAEEYLELLQRSQTQSAQVRHHCHDQKIIQHILKAATEAYKPLWFEDELTALGKD